MLLPKYRPLQIRDPEIVRNAVHRFKQKGHANLPEKVFAKENGKSNEMLVYIKFKKTTTIFRMVTKEQFTGTSNACE